jgi:hypothetical protein
MSKSDEDETASRQRLKVVEPPAEELDEDERALRALRLDLPGSSNVPSGIVSLSVGKIPRREFFRTHAEHRVVLPVVDHIAGLDTEFHVVAQPMVPELASIGIDVLPHTLYQIITAEGAVRLVPVRQADLDGSQNEWNRTKEIALVRGVKAWVRIVTDRANGRYRVFEAPEGRFPEPLWPDLTLAKIIRLAFAERGHLIDSPEHPLFKKWAARDGSTE